MRVLYELSYLFRWMLFFSFLLLFMLYRLLQFISKPGSRAIVPTGMVAAAYVYRPELHAWLYPLIEAQGPSFPIEDWLLDALLVIGLTIAACAYIVLSHLLALLLGAFPTVTQPLPPQRRLRVKSSTITPAVVRIVVPRLPRTR